MKVKNNRHLILFVLVLAATFSGYIWMLKQPFFQGFIEWSQQNFILYFFVLILIKTVAIVWPPIPGGLLTLGSIPMIGWFNAYLADLIGGLTGSSIAYYLGKRYGHSFLRKIFDEKTIVKINKIKIVKNKELEAIFLVRLFTGIISEAISYGSGLLGIKYRNFLLGTFLASLMFMPFFYLASGILSGKNILLNGIIVLIVGTLFYKLKGRYFE